MNCVGNNSKKDVIYKGRRIGEGENYMLQTILKKSLNCPIS